MTKSIDLTNQRFNYLTALKVDHIDKHHKVHWFCECSCGKSAIVAASRLKNGHTKSCGCYKLNILTKRSTSHGYANDGNIHPLYNVFSWMKQRCYNHDNEDYKYYGARNIHIDDCWINDISTFIQWSLSNGYAEGLQIDRIDNDGNYSPSNCRFVTCLKNVHNQRLLRSTNKSGYVNVSYNKEHNKFVADLFNCGKKYYFGYFITAKEAAMARDAFVVENNFDRKLNFTKEEVIKYINSK